MAERILSNMKVQFIVRLATALCFALFTVYQIFMTIQTGSNRIGRLIGVGLYLTITIASFFALSYSPRLQDIRSTLMLIGLLLLFVVRLVNIPALLGSLDFADIPSDLNFAAYVLPQIGTLVLTAMWWKRRKPDATLSEIAPLIPVAIALYALCFAAECVMMIRYRMYVEGSLKLALLSRLAYFTGFSGTAFIFFFNDLMKPFEPDPNFDPESDIDADPDFDADSAIDPDPDV